MWPTSPVTMLLFALHQTKKISNSQNLKSISDKGADEEITHEIKMKY